MRKGFEFSFTWLFAIIVGGSVLFLAIFAANRIVNTGNIETNTEVAAQLDAILSPLETNLESSKTYTISLPQETRIFNSCKSEGTFGQQEISTSVLSGDRWPGAGAEVSFFNKYIFSEQTVQGKNTFVFALPFSMPYKVADIMIMYTKSYCFISAPSEIKEEIQLANLPKVNFTEDMRLCERNSTSVCFNGEDCDIGVNTVSESVTKNGKTMGYYGSLLYGAIFSDPEIYDCQVKRIEKRAGTLADLYASKAGIIDSEGCAGSLATDLQSYSNELTSEKSIHDLSITAKEIGGKNERILCPLF